MLPEANIAVKMFRSHGCWRLSGVREGVANGATPERHLVVEESDPICGVATVGRTRGEPLVGWPFLTCGGNVE